MLSPHVCYALAETAELVALNQLVSSSLFIIISPSLNL